MKKQKKKDERKFVIYPPIPDEVAWAWVIIKYNQGVGLETYEKIEDIIKRNPRWFPWETRYNEIPQEVHEAYLKEKYPDRGKPIEFSESEGLYAQVKASQVRIPYELNIEKVFKDLEDSYKKEQEKKDKDKALWDKHYKKYNLKYRE